MNRITRMALGFGLTLLVILSMVYAWTFGVAREEARAAGIYRTALSLPAGAARFNPESLAALPEPARRYLAHAIRKDAPLARSVTLTTHGTIVMTRGSQPAAFTADERVSADGFLWEAHIDGGVMLRLTGYDAVFGRDGRAAFLLWSHFPLLRDSGPETARSAHGRHILERLMLPSSLLPSAGVHWSALDDTHASASFGPGEEDRIVLTVDHQGRLTEARGVRWGNPDGEGKNSLIPYGITVDEEGAVGGYTIPIHTRAWWEPKERIQFLESRVAAANLP